MRWYEKLYVGEKAIAADFEDAAALAGRIICEVYKKTGGYDVNSFLFGKGCCE